jgi:hypothetical protein
MQKGNDRSFERAFAERYAAARKHLRATMDALGMHEADGWRISETTEEMAGGSRVVLRPIHTRLVAPPDIECVVWIEEDGAAVDAECMPGGRPA